jgi:hypothetical protein
MHLAKILHPLYMPGKGIILGDYLRCSTLSLILEIRAKKLKNPSFTHTNHIFLPVLKV